MTPRSSASSGCGASTRTHAATSRAGERFLVRQQPDGTLYVAFAWLVETPKRWMSFLAPVARPAFTWNHDHMMRAFGSGLAQAARAEVLSTRNTTIQPGRPGFQVMPEPES